MTATDAARVDAVRVGAYAYEAARWLGGDAVDTAVTVTLVMWQGSHGEIKGASRAGAVKLARDMVGAGLSIEAALGAALGYYAQGAVA